jgi:Holliday junction resolvase RusA-like endonuclease
MEYILNVIPQATPRTRVNTVTGRVHNTSKYRQYIQTIQWEMKIKGMVRISHRDTFKKLEVDFYFGYPKGTPKIRLIEGHPHITKPDADNLLKGIKDSLEKLELIDNDSQFWDVHVRKFYTIKEPRIVIRII